MKKYTVRRLLDIMLYKVYLSFKIAELLNGILKYDLYILYFPHCMICLKSIVTVTFYTS